MKCKYCGEWMLSGSPVDGRRHHLCEVCGALYKEGRFPKEDAWLAPLFEEETWNRRRQSLSASK